MRYVRKWAVINYVTRRCTQRAYENDRENNPFGLAKRNGGVVRIVQYIMTERNSIRARTRYARGVNWLLLV